MNQNGATLILVAEDDDDHFLLTREAMEAAQLHCRMDRVRDGVELMDYLQRTGKYADLSGNPLPTLILLDLNMPKKDGREVMVEIKEQSPFNRIPLLAFSTSLDQEDVERGYDLGLNSFFRKPTHFSEWVDMMKLIKSYWLETAVLP